MSRYVLDASALIALLLGEPGHERVRELMDVACVHSLNVAEVIGKLVREGVPRQEAHSSLRELGLEVVESFPVRQAEECGALLARTRRQGLSLGDCVCLVAAASASAVAATAERRWKDLEGWKLAGGTVRVELIR